MCKMDMIKKIEELQSWENLMEEAKAEIEEKEPELADAIAEYENGKKENRTDKS